MFEEDAIDGGRVSGRLNGRRLQRGARLIVLVSVLAMLPSVGRADDVNITASYYNEAERAQGRAARLGV